MTAEEALNACLATYNIDATYMSHAEKIGKIYVKGIERGIQIAIDCALEIIDEVAMEQEMWDDDVRALKSEIEQLRGEK